jgi:hypothetical protein
MTDLLPQAPGPSPAPTAEEEVTELVAALRPRLADSVGESQVERLIREARAELGPVHVKTYLPILVERLVRQRARRPQTVATVIDG